MREFLERLVHEFERPFNNSVLVFSVILFIILLAPIVLKRLRIPGIIGLIISGIIIGPHGLNLIEKNSAVNLFSTIGLLYIMFIAGLELDLGEFRKNRNKSLVFGFLTFILPISLGIPVCYYLLGYPLDTSLLTASMFATHTLIAYPIVSRLGISKNEAVAITVGGTILTDTAVLIILAVISGAEKGGLTSDLWIRLGVSITIFLLIVAFIIPRIAAWFFKRLEDEKNAHFIFVLSVVFFCAFIAELSGLEPIIGAFAAGLTLNRLIPPTSSLMNRIEFVGNSLFIPFFLISVGMLIDIKVLSQGSQALIVAGSLTAVAVLGKWLASYTTGVIFSFSPAQRNLIFGLSSAHAAATLAVILVGYNIGLIDDNILNGTIVLILITCLVASFVTEDAGKKVVLQSEETEGTVEVTLKTQRILAPVSNPVTMEKLIDFAITIKEPKNPVPIIGLTVVEDGDRAQNKLLQARKMLDKVILHAAAADQKVEITATIDQNVSNGIQRVAKEMFITDIVLGWSPKNKISDIIFGKTFEGLISQTTQNVFLTRFMLPLNVHKKLILICPAFVEREEGFTQWLSRTLRLAEQLSMNITLHATENTYSEIKAYMASNKVSISIQFIVTRSLRELLKILRLTTNDMLVLVLSRKGNVSHNPYFYELPEKIVKNFSENSVVFIYPETRSLEGTDGYDLQTDNNLLEKGLTLLKGAKGIFNKSQSPD